MPVLRCYVWHSSSFRLVYNWPVAVRNDNFPDVYDKNASIQTRKSYIGMKSAAPRQPWHKFSANIFLPLLAVLSYQFSMIIWFNTRNPHLIDGSSSNPLTQSTKACSHYLLYPHLYCCLQEFSSYINCYVMASICFINSCCFSAVCQCNGGFSIKHVINYYWATKNRSSKCCWSVAKNSVICQGSSFLQFLNCTMSLPKMS